LPFLLEIEVMNPCLIILIVTLSLVTSKQLRADDFSLFLTLFGLASRDLLGTYLWIF
jgi:hypothetical protein